MHKQPDGLPVGIYFGLDEATYRADPALNYSGMKDLREGPEYYWDNSPMNPDWKPKRRTEEQRIGQILHTLLLEPENFSSEYYINPGEPYCTNRQPVRASDYKWMQECVRVVKTLPDLENLITYGAAEVVIIWEDPRTGLRMKAKHDYWKPFCSVDYKTSYGVHESAIKSAFYRYGYNMQAFHYVESRKQIREALLSMKADVYGKVDMRLIDRFIAGEGPDDQKVYMDNFVFIFQMKDSPHSARVFQLSDFTMSLGQQDVEAAASAYKENLLLYGQDRWMGRYGEIEELDMNYGFQRR